MFLEGLNITVKRPTTADQALHVLALSPDHSEKKMQRIYLKLFMLFGGTTTLNHLRHVPEYRISNFMNGREIVISVTYTQPPCSPPGWYLSEYYKEIPDERDISLVEDKELARLETECSDPSKNVLIK